MNIQSIQSDEFKVFGRVITEFDFKSIINMLETATEKPLDKVIYTPSDNILESLDVFKELQGNIYGGMPIQVGYCNGSNTKLNCLEYHRDSEINICADDIILLLARQQDIINNTLNTEKVSAFFVPKKTAIELYATTLHYAPCDGGRNNGFRVIVVLPKHTNTTKPTILEKSDEDKLLYAKNKWLIAHKDSPEAKSGAFVGLIGENIDVYNQQQEGIYE